MPRIILALAFAAAVASGAMPAAAQQEITLTVAAGQPLRAMNPLNLVSEFYIPEVNKRIEAAGLDIKINWKEAYAGSLLKPTFVLQGVSDGIADIGFEPTIFHPDKLPLEQVSFMTPFTTTDVELVGKARSTSCMRRFRNSRRNTTSSASSGSAARRSIPTSCSRPSPLQKFEDIERQEARCRRRCAAMGPRHGRDARREQHDALLQRRQDRRHRRLHHLPLRHPRNEVSGSGALS